MQKGTFSHTNIDYLTFKDIFDDHLPYFGGGLGGFYIFLQALVLTEP
jgi:hypothetical protein